MKQVGQREPLTMHACTGVTPLPLIRQFELRSFWNILDSTRHLPLYHSSKLATVIIIRTYFRLARSASGIIDIIDINYNNHVVILQPQNPIKVSPSVLSHVMRGQVWPEGTRYFHSNIRIPTLIVHGETDPFVSFQEDEEMFQVDSVHSAIIFCRDAAPPYNHGDIKFRALYVLHHILL